MSIAHPTEPVTGSGRRTLSSALPGWPARPQPGGEHVIGVLPGEGIGREVMDAALNVLEAVSRASSRRFDVRTGGLIGLPAKEAHGYALTGGVTEFCKSVFADRGAILCGPASGRFVYDLRTRFDLFCKLSPVRPFRSLADSGVVRPRARAGVDVVVVRENTGGVYFGTWGTKKAANGRETAFHHFEYDEAKVTRVLEVALRLAGGRSNRLCLVVKREGLPAISELWRARLEDLAAGLDVDTRVLEIDNAAFQLIATAQSFDVVVAPNMFGDILSDGAALLLGSRGMSYSGNFGGGGIAVYQTGHGAAHDIAGNDMANPIGQIQSLAMMLRESFGLCDVADAVDAAIERTLGEGWRTADIAADGCRVVGTREMGDRIAQALEGPAAEATRGA